MRICQEAGCPHPQDLDSCIEYLKSRVEDYNDLQRGEACEALRSLRKYCPLDVRFKLQNFLNLYCEREQPRWPESTDLDKIRSPDD